MTTMVSKPLRAVVIGAGLAGEGHARALRYYGVEVAAICARLPDVVRAVAERLAIPEASTDWRQTLETIKPDIVALATPASLRTEPIELACALGCHVYCDKPLAATGAEGKRIFDLASASGIKHAFAATLLYDPSVAYLAELVRDGAIGRLLEVECTLRWYFRSPHPWSWADTIAGGGVFGSNLPHILGILERVIGGKARRVSGETRVFDRRQPVVPGIHDTRDLLRHALTPEELERLEWREADAEQAASALFQFETPSGEVALTFNWGSALPYHWPTGGIRLFGEAGTLVAEGWYTAYSLYRVTEPAGGREALPVPERLARDLPGLGNGSLDKWAALARDFLADVQGQPHRPYLTFRDGWRYQEAIDAIRAGDGWHELPD